MGSKVINVGGRLFTTSLETLEKGGTSSTLYQGVSHSTDACFYDRDPDMFNSLLNMLRTGVLYPQPDSSTLDRLIEEATFYGIEEFLKTADGRVPLNGLDIQKAKPVIPSGIEIPSAMAAGADGSVWVSHGSKLTVYDWALRKQKTTLTDFSLAHVLHRVTNYLVAAGALDVPGLHFYDPIRGVHIKSLIWTDPQDVRVYSPTVRAITSNGTSLFASFESGQKLDNTLVSVDKNTLQITREFGRQSGGTAHLRAGTKLQWLHSKNLLLVGSVQGGSFGYAGYMRLWDVRSDKVVWDWKEPNFQATRGTEREMFSDMTVDEDLGAIFKVGVQSGVVSLADLRHLDGPDPWMELMETNSSLQKVPAGANKKLITYNKQVYISRGADVEVWSEVPLAEVSEEKEYTDTSFRRNFLEHRRHSGQEVTQMVAGGNRLFVARKDFQGVEVWDSRG